MTLEPKDPKFSKSAVHPYLLVHNKPTKPLRRPRKPITAPAENPALVPSTLRQTREYSMGMRWFLEAYMETLVRNLAMVVALAARDQESFQRGMMAQRLLRRTMDAVEARPIQRQL
jgi:hypothetical protein